MTNPLFDRLFAPHAGQETVFLYLEDGEQITHAAFLDLVARFANALGDLGVKAGDRIALQVEKCVEALAVYGACVQTGVIFLPLNTAYTADEVSYFLENSRAGLFICDPGSEAAMGVVAKTAGSMLETLASHGRGTLAKRAARMSATCDVVDRAPGDLTAFLYTSGTTGRSKGAMLSQDNLLSNALVLAEAWQFTADDILLHALPIFHTHGLFVATNVALASGGAMIFQPKFDADQVIAALPRATTMMGVPTFYTRLLQDVRLDRALTAHMRLFVSGSAPLLAETHTQFEERTGHRILERYGMTETNMNTSNPLAGERRPGTVGFPLPGIDLKITDPTSGETLPDGAIGQIEVRGPNVFQGYWQMPEKTREELRENGFFITGDLGKVDADGYVHIVGRNKDLIISGGYNIYPKEIEVILDDQPAVQESAVIGVPHPDFGETPVGILVPQTDKVPDLPAIETSLKEALARFKHPRRLIVADALPRNTMGKVQKNLLRDQYRDLFTRH